MNPTFNPFNAGPPIDKKQALKDAIIREQQFSTTRSGIPVKDFSGATGLTGPNNGTGGRKRRRTVRRRSIRRRRSSRRRHKSRRR